MYKTHTLHHGVNELKHEEEQSQLVELLNEGYEIISTGSLPDRIVYILGSSIRIPNNEKRVMHNVCFDKEGHIVKTPHDGGTLKEGVIIAKNGRYVLKGKGFIKKEDAYDLT